MTSLSSSSSSSPVVVDAIKKRQSTTIGSLWKQTLQIYNDTNRDILQTFEGDNKVFESFRKVYESFGGSHIPVRTVIVTNVPTFVRNMVNANNGRSFRETVNSGVFLLPLSLLPRRLEDEFNENDFSESYVTTSTVDDVKARTIINNSKNSTANSCGFHDDNDTDDDDTYDNDYDDDDDDDDDWLSSSDTSNNSEEEEEGENDDSCSHDVFDENCATTTTTTTTPFRRQLLLGNKFGGHTRRHWSCQAYEDFFYPLLFAIRNINGCNIEEHLSTRMDVLL